MEQNAKQNKLPLLGMIVTTALVLGALCALLWWSTHRWSVYARRAMAAAARQDWAAAESWGQKAESAGAADVLNEIAAQKADALFESGDYDAARALYGTLGDARQVMACAYRQAEALEAAGDLTAARDGFLSAAGYEDALQRADRCRYALAEAALAAGDQQAAFDGFLALGDFEDAPDRARALAVALTGEANEEDALLSAQGYTPEVLSLQEQLQQKRDGLLSRRLAAGHAHALLLLEDGTVRAAGDNGSGQCDVSDWKGVVAVAAGYAHSLGLTGDGRVLAAGNDEYGQCDVSDWRDVVSIYCGPFDSYGVTRDGTMLHTGFKDLSALAGWTGVQRVSAGDGVLFALRENGSVLSSLPDQVPSWQDALGLAAAGHAPVGLKKDGTLLSADRDLSAWTDVVAIDSSAALLVGLRLDGTLLVEPLLMADEGLLTALRAEETVVGLSVAGTYALLLHEDGTLTAPGASFDLSPLTAPQS
jgi:hypothetical protein